jgi:hypothetical protein
LIVETDGFNIFEDEKELDSIIDELQKKLA